MSVNRGIGWSGVGEGSGNNVDFSLGSGDEFHVTVEDIDRE